MNELPKEEKQENLERLYRLRKANPTLNFDEIGEMVGIAGDEVFKKLKQRALSKNKQQLTKREVEIIELIKLGMNNQQICEKLWISKDTVRIHTVNIFRKLKKSREEIIQDKLNKCS